MNRVNVIFGVFVFLVFQSCASTSSPYKEYKVTGVPYHSQGSNETYCQPASIYMITEYLAGRLGWYDSSFISSNESQTLTTIHNYLLNNGGVYWFPYSREGAPSSYSSFLYMHLMTNDNSSAKLNTLYTPILALDFQANHFKTGGMPLVVCFQWPTGKNHAVVMTGVQVDPNYSTSGATEYVKQVYYHDPIYGPDIIESSMDTWRMRNALTSGYGASFQMCSMSMSFEDILVKNMEVIYEN